jgi:hypothetical protein
MKNDPVVIAGEGFNTLLRIIVTLEIAELVKIALLIINVWVPLKVREILLLTVTSFI